MTNTKDIVRLAISGMEEKKGLGIVEMNLSNIEHAVCDYFIICHGSSDTQVDALADSVVDTVFKGLREKPIHFQGKENSQWILIDYGDVIVHVFQESVRKFYNLEELWADAVVNAINEK